MIAIGHTSVGVLIGVAASEFLPASLHLPSQIIITGIAGIASHYLMDLLPHGHYGYDMSKPNPIEKLKLVVDFVLPVVILGIYLLFNFGFGAQSWLVGAGVLGAQLPDIVNGFRKLDKLPDWYWLNREGYYHSLTHWHNPQDASKATAEGGRKLGLSDIWQAALVCLAIFVLLQ